MTGYAARIQDGVVTQVIVGTAAWAADRLGGLWVDSPSKVGVGWQQHEGRLRPPAPFPSWNWDGSAWQPPTPSPDGYYLWNEATLSWVSVEDML